MGYEIYIRRDENSHAIAESEWKSYVNSDASLSLSSDKMGICNWNEHPLGGIEAQTPWLRFSEGQISTKNPDEFLTLKMFEIAESLNANLYDDEAMLEDDYKNELERDTKNILNKSITNSKPWWRFW